MIGGDQVSGRGRLRLGVMALAILELGGTAWAQQMVEPWPTAVLAPSGYTAAVNSPTADVLPWGTAALGFSNSNPERSRSQSAGRFGSLNPGISPLPGLELVGRLAYEGDLNCNMFQPDCRGGQRDLSLSGKYQLPLELPLDTRLALGFTDYGGAATQYRQLYGVATSTVGPLDLSLGYGRPKAAAAMLDGAFGSAALRLDERWSAALEHDSRAARLGLAWRQPLARDLSLQLAASRKLAGDAPQQTWQLNAQLSWVMGRAAGSPVALMPAVGSDPGSPSMARSASVSSSLVPEPVQTASLPAGQAGSSAEALVQALERAGFARIGVRILPARDGFAALWEVSAEPVRWRQSQIDALGAALQAWRRQRASGSDELALSLTHQGQPVLGVHTSAACLQAWVEEGRSCPLAGRGPALRLYRLADWPDELRRRMGEASVQAQAGGGLPAWMPQFEIGPGLRTTVGTEYGLSDYSLSLELGFEAGLGQGLSLQGVASTPVARSDDFGPGRVFGAQRHPDTGLDSVFLSYWRPLPRGMAVQGAVGQLDRHHDGGQLDGHWMSDDGRWRLAGLAARYRNDLDLRWREPLLASLRYSVAPGVWHLDATAGRFMNGDQGYKLMSSHWMGDMRFSLYYRRSEAGQEWVMPQRSFLGFEVSLPLGPGAASQLGPVAVRGRDRWGWGVETKVGDRDNALTQGYGLLPRLRHGLTTDVTDHDRAGALDMQAQLPRLRALLSQP